MCGILFNENIINYKKYLPLVGEYFLMIYNIFDIYYKMIYNIIITN